MGDTRAKFAPSGRSTRRRKVRVWIKRSGTSEQRQQAIAAAMELMRPEKPTITIGGRHDISRL